jgi:thioesterase domain-containing protein/acyl carrier protein
LKPALPWSVETLRRHALDRLPDFMVPSVFVRLDALPLNKNGKVDRRALPAPDLRERRLERDYEPPRDALELHLAKVWESALKTSPIGLDDDFFDLGGHSLLAVRLFAEIEKATGRKLPLATLFQAPTVRQIAEVLREKGWASPWTSLVPIQPRGSRPPFYCVHAVGGSVLPYRVLAKRLGPDQPFYGLQARALANGEHVAYRVEEMAEQYLAEIRSFQPRGPYFVGGHSAGGLVAFEIARRLRLAGEEVALLALFDTWAPGHGKIIPERLLRLRWQIVKNRAKRFWTSLRRGGRLAYLREKLAVRLRVLRGEAVSNLPPEIQRVKESMERAIDDYHPAHYPGAGVLFRAAEQPREYAIDRTLGWNALCLGGVEVHEVPGHHGELVSEPGASVLAERIRECLDRAIRRPVAAEAAPGS